MSRYHFSSKHSIDDSNKRSPDPGSTKFSIPEKTTNHKQEKYDKTPLLIPKLKPNVQSNAEPSNPAKAPAQFKLGIQRRSSLPAIEPIAELIPGPNKKEGPSSPIRENKIIFPKTVGNVQDSGVNDNIHNNNWSSQAKVLDPVKDKKKRDKLTTVPDEKYTSIEEINYKHVSPSNLVPDRTYRSSTKNSRVVDEKPGKPSTLDHNHGYEATDPIRYYPEHVPEFILNVQTEVSRPSRAGFMTGMNWRNITGNQDLNKSNINATRYEQYVEPFTVPKTGWEGLSKREWALPQTQATSIYGPTKDIGTAVNTLKEVVRSAPSPRYNYDYTDSKNLESDTKAGAIDSREAQRRYGNQNPLARRPSANYVRSISSTEAARKYGGTPV